MSCDLPLSKKRRLVIEDSEDENELSQPLESQPLVSQPLESQPLVSQPSKLLPLKISRRKLVVYDTESEGEIKSTKPSRIQYSFDVLHTIGRQVKPIRPSVSISTKGIDEEDAGGIDDECCKEKQFEQRRSRGNSVCEFLESEAMDESEVESECSTEEDSSSVHSDFMDMDMDILCRIQALDKKIEKYTNLKNALLCQYRDIEEEKGSFRCPGCNQKYNGNSQFCSRRCMLN